jgi:hypothetical protein
VGEDGHGGDGEHLREGEDPCADVVVAVELVVHGPVDPGQPDQDEEEGRLTDAGQRDVLGQVMTDLGDDHHIDQVIEELEERDGPVLLAVSRLSGRLPPPAEALEC